jgi:RNA polymerase sigma-70 factor (ECF subfamily)
MGQHLIRTEEKRLVAGLRDGDEEVFAQILTAWSPSMLRVAEVSGRASAAHVVQEAWLAVIERLDRYHGRPPLRVWVFSVLVDLVRSRTGFTLRVDDETGPFVDPARFRGPDDRWPGGWTPDGVPEDWPSRATDHDAGYVAAALGRLPAGTRMLVTLRDVCGFTADEVSAILGISSADQRSLLHYGRSRIRSTLEERYRQSAGVA